MQFGKGARTVEGVFLSLSSDRKQSEFSLVLYSLYVAAQWGGGGVYKRAWSHQIPYLALLILRVTVSAILSSSHGNAEGSRGWKVFLKCLPREQGLVL